MRFPKLTKVVLLSSILICLVQCTPAPGLGLLHVPIRRSNSISGSSLSKRSFEEIELLHQSDVYYSAVLKIGTPSQEIPVVLDTGSADLWVASSSNPFCLNTNGGSSYSNQTYDGHPIEPSVDCAVSGTYDYEKSSSMSKLDIGRFFINYSDGSLADGFWACEKMSVGGIDISGLQFGIADYATAPVGGVLGIGFARRESVQGYGDAPGAFYPNFPQVLEKEGVIDVVAYSLYLNKGGGESGSILFGAVDSDKYTGSLYTFPMVNEYPQVVDKPATLAMTLQGIGAKSDAKCERKTFSTTKLPVLLDSGTTLMSAPQEIADEMASFVGAAFSEDEGIYVFACPSENDDTEFVFDFGDVKITVPLSSLVLLPPSNGSCGFGVLPAPYSMTLGSAFLSSAYVVYDLDNYQISLAQAKHDSGSSKGKLTRIRKDGSIPGATKATAVAWQTDEPIAVNYDIFDGDLKLCSGSNGQTVSTSIGKINGSASMTYREYTESSNEPMSTVSPKIQGNVTPTLQVEEAPESSDNSGPTGVDTVADTTQESSANPFLDRSPQYVTVTMTEIVVSTVGCHFTSQTER